MSLDKYLSLRLYNEKTLNRVYSAQESKLDSVNYDIQDLKNNCFIQTSTWGLDIFEKEYGIPTIETDSYEIRRSRILAKKRSNGMVTKAMIQNIAESFSNGTVEVIEDNASYSFTIKFVSTIGIPPKIQDLYDAINKIKPAHLVANYEFTYKTWNDIKSFTWGDLTKYTWNDVLNKTLQTNITTLYSMQSDGSFSPIQFQVEAINTNALYSKLSDGTYKEIEFKIL